MRKFNIIYIALVLIIANGCLEPFAPPEINRPIDFLVVEGFLNSTDGKINVKLSHARPLNSTDGFLPERNAQVSLESESGTIVAIPETGQGNYYRDGLAIDPDLTYSLKIKTSQGKEYASAFVEVIPTPPIDSVTMRPAADGINILVNTHDDLNKTRYYQWRFIETWRYNAPQQSSYIFQNGTAIEREIADQIYACYSTLPSTVILASSTNRLSSSVIRDFKVTTIPAGSRKISNKYSILVQQSGISQEAYEFWALLQQTTENLGGLFDPQPGKVVGNLRSISDSSEPVLGIFQAGSVEEKRIYITFLNIPEHLRYRSTRLDCRPDSITVANLPNFSSQISLLVGGIYEGLTVVGYTYVPQYCADCRFEGGSLTKPDFWE